MSLQLYRSCLDLGGVRVGYVGLQRRGRRARQSNPILSSGHVLGSKAVGVSHASLTSLELTDGRCIVIHAKDVVEGCLHLHSHDLKLGMGISAAEWQDVDLSMSQSLFGKEDDVLIQRHRSCLLGHVDCALPIGTIEHIRELAGDSEDLTDALGEDHVEFASLSCPMSQDHSVNFSARHLEDFL